MSWIKLDDNFPDHPKVEDITDGAFRMHVAALCYCSRNLTDGFVSVTRARRLTAHDDVEPLLAELAAVGLWHQVDGGWLIHDYLDWQASADHVRDQRERTRERVQRWRKNRGNAVTPPVTNAVSNPVSNNGQTETETETETEREVRVGSLREPAHTPHPGIDDIKRLYTDKVPLSNHPAITKVITAALRYYPTHTVAAAITRLADTTPPRPVTIDTLRIEIDGKPNYGANGQPINRRAAAIAAERAKLAKDTGS